MTTGSSISANRLQHLTTIGIALSAERNLDRLLTQILLSAKDITGADGGTIYRRDGDKLHYELICNDTLRLSPHKPMDMDGVATFQPVPLYLTDKMPNNTHVAAHVALTGNSINISDVYSAEFFDFTGPKKFDTLMKYRSLSVLTVPLRDPSGDVLGVLQLLNAKDSDGNLIPFGPDDQVLAEALASQATVAWSNHRLIHQMDQLLESFAEVLGIALDDKSPHTRGHCARVPVLTLMLADAAHEETAGPLKDFVLTEDSRYELKVAAMLHDIGKVSTPTHVVDKATKLQTVHDRISEIAARFEVLKLEADLACAQFQLDGGSASEANRIRDSQLQALDNDLDFIRQCNKGTEFVAPDRHTRLAQLGQRTWGNGRPLLTPDEVDNLSIPRGTITPAERSVINNHVTTTLRMLEALPWPDRLKLVPLIAGGHHERMDGKGYPYGLHGSDLLVQTRIIAIADVFEALTAKDRPYKDGNTLSEALRILREMGEHGHLDPDLLEVFFREKLYLRYAAEYMHSRQVDMA